MTLRLLQVLGSRAAVFRAATGAPPADALARDVAGLRFPNPLGLAAGYDKDASALPALAALGFGFVEIGTVTPRAQPGNPRPRVARLREETGLMNALGFPSAGAEIVAARLARLRGSEAWRRIAVPIAASLGKMRSTPTEEAAADYASVLRALAPHADLVVINVSSPNTPGLTQLQQSSHFDSLLESVAAVNRGDAEAAGRREPPLFAKLSPDLDPVLLDEMVEIAVSRGLAGLVLTNTRAAQSPPRFAARRCGLSGAPLRAAALAAIERARKRAGSRLALIGVGGIMAADDAVERLSAGADLLQIYTGLVYAGPALVGRILSAIGARAVGGAAAPASVSSGGRTP